MTDETPTEKAAIAAALAQDWKSAIALNLELLKKEKNNINILNRLGFAYLQRGQFAAAKRTFAKVIKLDEYNQIALKNLKKLGSVRQKDVLKSAPKQLSPLLFLEEPGKTKIVECVNTAPTSILASVSPGEEVLLHARNHVVEVRNDRNVYLGAIPDDLSFRLIKFLGGGNTYQALVKSIGKNTLTIFLRELSRGKRFVHQPSFASNAIYLPTSQPERTEEAEGQSELEEES